MVSGVASAQAERQNNTSPTSRALLSIIGISRDLVPMNAVLETLISGRAPGCERGAWSHGS